MGAKYDAYLVKYKEGIDASIAEATKRIEELKLKVDKMTALYDALKQQATSLNVVDSFNKAYPKAGQFVDANFTEVFSVLYATGDDDFTKSLKSFHTLRNSPKQLTGSINTLNRLQSDKEKGGEGLFNLIKGGISNLLIEYVKNSGGKDTLATAYKKMISDGNLEGYRNLVLEIYYDEEPNESAWDNRPLGVADSQEAYAALIEAHEEGKFIAVEKVEPIESAAPSINESDVSESDAVVSSINEPSESKGELPPSGSINEPSSTESESVVDTSGVESNEAQIENQKTFNETPKELSTPATEISAPPKELGASINEISAPAVSNVTNTTVEEGASTVIESSNNAINSTASTLKKEGDNLTNLEESNASSNMLTSEEINNINNFFKASDAQSINEETVVNTNTEITNSNKSINSVNSSESGKPASINEETNIKTDINNNTESNESVAGSLLTADEIKTINSVFANEETVVNDSKISINDTNSNESVNTETLNAVSTEPEVIKSEIGIDKKVAPLNTPASTKSDTQADKSTSNVETSVTEVTNTPVETTQTNTNTSNEKVNNESKVENTANNSSVDLSEVSARLKRIENILAGTLDVKIVD